ncbi:MAG: hypothetical protein JW818_18585 [Pirellulales bacterium]|nr:hypothetical protein [Pirellulales bacterium]
MARNVHRGFIFAILLATGLSAACVLGMGPAERLLPNTTKGALLVTNAPDLVKHWEATQLGQLMADPVMEPFAKDLRHQFEDRLSRLHERLGLQVKDLKGVPSGQLAVGLIRPGKEQAALALIVDVRGHTAEATALLNKVTENLKKQNVPPPSEEQIAGSRVMVFDLPKTAEYPAGKAAYFLNNEVLAASDNVEVLAGILRRQLGQGQPGESLADVPVFQQVMIRCQKDAGQAVPQVRWFLEPLGYVEAIRTMTPKEKLPKRVTILDIMREQGFTAVQGIGGFVDLHVGSYEVLHRTSIYAPPPFQKAPLPYVDKVTMRLLTFPNSRQFTPPDWVPNDVAVCTTFYWDTLAAFDNVAPLFNEMFGDRHLFKLKPEFEAALQAKTLPEVLRKEFAENEFPLEPKSYVLPEEPGKWRIISGKSAFMVTKTSDKLSVDLINTTSWDELLETLRSSPPNGVDMDIRSELVAPLGNRVMILTDYQLNADMQITPSSERLLFAIEAKDEAAVAKGIEKFYKNDRLIKKSEFEGHIIWETIEDPRHKNLEPPILDDLPDFSPDRPKKPHLPKRHGKKKELLPHQSVTVAHGHLLVASHVDFLVKVLQQSKTPDPLTKSVDYRLVAGAMQQLGAGEGCVRSFSRTDEEYRPTYELIRQGKMPESETMFGRMLNALLTPRKRGAVREQKIGGQKLPDFQVVRRYLGPAGLFGRTEPDGWFLTGFMLKR